MIILISMSTPAGRLRLDKASMVLGLLSLRSINRLCVRISNCSREVLCTKVDLLTVNFSILVGRGMGPLIMAPVRSAVSMMSLVVSSMTLWSNAFTLIRRRCLGALTVLSALVDDLAAFFFGAGMLCAG